MNVCYEDIYIYLRKNIKVALDKMNRKSGNDKKWVYYDDQIKALFSEGKYLS